MRPELAWSAAAGLCLLGGCLKFDPFACSNDTQCNLAGQAGYCVGEGVCAYPDFGCASGLRYDEHAGNGLGGACVGEETETGASDVDTTGSTGGSESTGTSTPDTGETSATETGGACGGPGEPCCDGSACDDGLTCAGTACGCAISVAAGQRHTCAIKVDGSVWCWGANDLGQVGAPAGPAETTPVMVENAFESAHASSLSARNHTCALRDDDTAVCWGNNAVGQSDPTDAAEIVEPRSANWATPTTGVAAGQAHTCALRSRGTVVSCWGANDSNQLGSIDPGPGPVHVAGQLALEHVDLGDAHGCGVTSTGELWCWGDNAQGQLAQDPTLLPSSDVLLQVALPNVDEVALGARHTCARVGNEVSCWGRNGQGQLGDGSGAQQFLPVAVALPPGLTLTAIVSGPDHTCAIEQGGALWCWGSNDRGQLMLEPDANGNDMYTLTPVEVEVGAEVRVFAGGGTHSCALVDTGEILCWGTNTDGQIGDGTTSYAFEPEPVDLACP